MTMKRHLHCGALALAAALLAGCQKPDPAANATPPPPTVTVSQPEQKDIVEWDEYQARLEAIDSVEVRARVSGYLKSVHFKDGAEVKRGDLLFVIDPRPYQAELDRAQAELLEAQTRFELASNEVQRAGRLLQVKAISAEEADSRAKNERGAAAAIDSARATVEMAQLNFDYSRITSPIDGRIGRKLITEGNLVNGNQGDSTLLATIVSMDPIYCYFDADERSVLKYQQLARAPGAESFASGTVPCAIALAGESGFPHAGVLDFMDNRVDPTTGTLRVRGVFPNPDRVLEPGFFARVRVPGSVKYPALLIPDAAVGTDQGQNFVLTVDAQNVAQYTPVKLGPLLEDGRVVREGLHSSDWVVVNGLMSIRPGAKVNPSRATAPVATTR
jgi:multidrug efflux system membrane fusion protein